ncbi:heme ABC transporter ATP-binding protein [Tepiditoga spiralis]|uniref:Heme ABC transporter ATP-binding protein n=1 Tax=Tepiditoga spiralis TaxID=2108365 RepID=A0A7G1G8P5_9BACT|nr:ABC transporter ATP-binding protein [Tepiditoga spiralis]BBE31614.1 heme ABC transporter ATP-binding protein [Tepiditoga spiralis]
MINVKNLNLKIENKKILKNINLNINKKGFYGILGPNGSGKTTLLDVLTGIRNDFNGTVKLFNKSISNLTKKEIAKKVSLVPQSFEILFPFSIFEIIEMGRYPHKNRFEGLKKYDLKVIEKVLKDMDLFEIKEQNVMTLSGGEKQRIIFARALVQETELLFLDESTSNLDLYYTHTLLKLVKEKVNNNNLTVISVFHDFNLASMYCDEIFLMKDGEIKKHGITKDVLTPENIFDIFKIKTSILNHKNKKILIPI